MAECGGVSECGELDRWAVDEWYLGLRIEKNNFRLYTSMHNVFARTLSWSCCKMLGSPKNMPRKSGRDRGGVVL